MKWEASVGQGLLAGQGSNVIRLNFKRVTWADVLGVKEDIDQLEDYSNSSLR